MSPDGPKMVPVRSSLASRWPRDGNKMASRRVSRIYLLSRRFPFHAAQVTGSDQADAVGGQLGVLAGSSAPLASASEAGKGGLGGNPVRGLLSPHGSADDGEV